MPVIEGFRDLIEETSLITADAGYQSEANLKELAGRKIEALIADKGMRSRDERFTDQAKHKAKPDALWDKTASEKRDKLFGPKDFEYDEESKTCICPAGEFLYQNGSQVVFSTGVVHKAESHTQRMKNKIDSEEGRARYGQRFATVEPVFGSIRHNKRLNRFTLRGQKKVDTQWKLYCMVHSIEKLAHCGNWQ